LALLAMPMALLPVETIRRIVAGGEAACARAGIPVAGGHTIDSVEPIYGLAVIGTIHPDRIKRNGGAKPGDALILGKPLGVGVYSAALRKDALSTNAYNDLVAQTTQLNTPGMELGALAAVHAMTDITGFGLLGHLLEMCRASDTGATIEFDRVPLLPETLELAKRGHLTGASARNFAGYGSDVAFAAAAPELAQPILTDPQTSGGLLVACAPERADEVLGLFRRKDFGRAATIGVMTDGAPRVSVR
jgi:selenide,water dikinase